MTDKLTRETVLSAFRSEFGTVARIFRAPARINIIGEHTDYNDGFVMPVNTAIYTWIAIAPREDRIVRMHSTNFGQSVEVSLDDISSDADNGWHEYLKGVLDRLLREGFDIRGADVQVSGNIPIGGGLSSSASLEAAFGFAMLSCSGYDVDRSQLALICQAAENEFVGVSCGIMDQYVISLCENNHAMLLDCRSLEYESVPLLANVDILVVNSGVERRLREGGLNERRRECEEATAMLATKLAGVSALRDVSMGDLDRHRDFLGKKLYARSRHVVSELDRVDVARQAMTHADPVMLGRVMTASHISLRDDFDVSCDELNALVDIALACEGVFGSRMVGAGFGGCTITLVDPMHLERLIEKVCTEYGARLSEQPWYHVIEPSDPVHELELP